MSSLNSLKLTNDQRPVPAFKRSPIEKARAAVLSGIAVQRDLINADLNGTVHSLTKQVVNVDDQGNKVTTTVNRKPRKWYFQRSSDGLYVVEVLFANHPVLLNGKQSVVEAGDLQGVLNVIGVIATAVEKGELDKALTDIAAKRKSSKKAA